MYPSSIRRTLNLATHQLKEAFNNASIYLNQPIYDPDSQTPVAEQLRAAAYNCDIRGNRLSDAIAHISKLDRSWLDFLESLESQIESAEEGEVERLKATLSKEEDSYKQTATNGYLPQVYAAGDTLHLLEVRQREIEEHKQANNTSSADGAQSNGGTENALTVSEPQAVGSDANQPLSSTVAALASDVQITQGTGFATHNSTRCTPAVTSLPLVQTTYQQQQQVPYTFVPAAYTGAAPFVPATVAPVSMAVHQPAVQSVYNTYSQPGAVHQSVAQPHLQHQSVMSQGVYQTYSQPGAVPQSVAHASPYSQQQYVAQGQLQTGFVWPPSQQGGVNPQFTVNQPYVLPVSGNPAIVPQVVQSGLHSTPSPVRVDYPARPTFDGTRSKYLKFINRFMALIGNNPSFNAVTKLEYLLSSMVPNSPASAALETCMPMESEYYRALDILHQRFGGVNQLRDSLYRTLQQQPKVNNQPSKLRKFVDSVASIVAQLNQLGDDTENSASMLLIHVQERLPYEVLQHVQLQKPTNARWTMSGFLHQLDQYITQLEQLSEIVGGQYSRSDKDQVNKSHSQSVKPKQHHQPGQSSTAPAPTTALFMARSSSHATPPAATKKEKHWSNQKKGNLKSVGRSLSRPCIFCDEQHRDADCMTYPTMAGRRRRLIEKKLCTLCLKEGHFVKDCPNSGTRKCYFCASVGRHYSGICPEKFRSVQPVKESTGHSSGSAKLSTISAPAVTETFSGMIVTTHDAVLSTAKVKICNPDEPERELTVQAILDGGSQRNYLEEKTALELQLKMVPSNLNSINSIGATKVNVKNSKVGIIIAALDDGTFIRLPVTTTPDITTPKAECCPLNVEDIEYLKQLTVENEPSIMADEVMLSSYNFHPKLLLGNGVVHNFLEALPPLPLPSGLIAVPTKVGYVLAGHKDNNSHDTTVMYIETADEHHHNLNMEDDHYGSLELIGIEAPTVKADEDVEAERQFNETVQFFHEEKRVVVCWPWREPPDSLPNNKFIAHRSLESLCKKLNKQPDIAQQYSQRIVDQLAAGVIEEAPSEPDGPVYYNPHHAVLTPGKSTSLRVVYNASSKHKKNEKSLNDVLLRGPIRLPLIMKMLMMFRIMTYVIASDLEKAFLQVSLREDQRDVTRFLWLKDPTSLKVTSDNIKEYRFRRVNFGVVSSPYLLQAAIGFHLDHQQTELAKQLKSDSYVDNILSGVETPEQAITYYDTVKPMFASASWNLREFITNCDELREYIGKVRPSDLAKTTSKILGLCWSSTTDTIQLRGLKDSINSTEPITRQKLFSYVPSVYDPLGLVVPLTLAAKLWFQKTWSLPRQVWGDVLPEEYQLWWNVECERLKKISNLKFPRRITPNYEVTCTRLHVFVDASKYAYCAAAYLQFLPVEPDNSTSVQLLIAKQRLAPTKKFLTIPRLETMANVIGVRLAAFIVQSVRLTPSLSSVTVWTDSMIALSWIRDSADNYKVWVSNRVREINNTLSSLPVEAEVRYVPTNLNPADLGTRPDAVSCEHLSDASHPWWTGPTFLRTNSESLPTFEQPILKADTCEQIELERRVHETYLNMNVTHEPWFSTRDVATRMSRSKPRPIASSTPQLTRVSRVMIIVLRFIMKTFGALFNKWPKNLQQTGFMEQYTHMEHLNNTNQTYNAAWHEFALRVLILCDQQEHFSGDRQTEKVLQQLKVKQDKYGIWRVHHRLPNKPGVQLAPVLLSSKSHLTEAVVMSHHVASGHLTMPSTLTSVRSANFWILKGRQAVKRVIKDCQTCKRNFGGPYRQPSYPDLPDERTQVAAPFSRVGIDYFGPTYIREGTETVKVWTCCLPVWLREPFILKS